MIEDKCVDEGGNEMSTKTYNVACMRYRALGAVLPACSQRNLQQVRHGPTRGGGTTKNGSNIGLNPDRAWLARIGHSRCTRVWWWLIITVPSLNARTRPLSGLRAVYTPGRQHAAGQRMGPCAFLKKGGNCHIHNVLGVGFLPFWRGLGALLATW